MKKSFQDIVSFHRGIKAPVGDPATIDCKVDLELRVKLIAEEFDELLSALCPRFGESQFVTEAVENWIQEQRSLGGEPDPVEVADALADMSVVTIGSAVAWGVPLPEVWDEVHSSNMAKLGGPIRSDGKQLKPPGWTPPDVAGVLQRVANECREWRKPLPGAPLCAPAARCAACAEKRLGGGCGEPVDMNNVDP